MFNDDIISMPDKWEYPWYAAWDLAFHMIPLGMVDPDFAKQQLDLMLRNDYLHPNGQLPAYEWNFGDVNPPVHAWATMQLYLFDKERRGGSGDIEFLKYAFSKLLVNFTWWVNRKDRTGANVFEGGFLGLDNIGVFDRSSPLPTGGYLDQADGTAWMVFFSQQMLRIAVELALHEPLYEEFVEKFFQHTLFIAGAMDRVGERHDEMWDEEDGFFYDVLRFPDGTRDAAQGALDRRPAAAGRGGGLRGGHPREAAEVPRARAAVHRAATPSSPPTCTCPDSPAWPTAGCCRSSTRRSCGASSRACWTRPSSSARTASARCRASTSTTRTSSTTAGRSIAWPTCRAIPTRGMFGGNSNWRGPVWMPINFLLYTRAAAPLRLLRRRLQGRVPDRLGADDDAARGRQGTGRAPEPHLPARRRPAAARCTAPRTSSSDDPHWRDLVLFYEYFHGDTGAGIGASHQTGWTGCVARIIQAQCRAHQGPAAHAGRGGGGAAGAAGGREADVREAGMSSTG